MNVFVNDDAGYREWLKSNPNGMVLNSDKAGNRPEYPMAHLASHGLLRSAEVFNYTSGDYLKVCSNSFEELQAWSQLNRGKQPVWCAECLKRQGDASRPFENLLRRMPSVASLLSEIGFSQDAIRADRTFASEWCWQDAELIVATVWQEELQWDESTPWVAYADPSARQDLTGARRRRAIERFMMLRAANGRNVRVILQSRSGISSTGQKGSTRGRGIDSAAWSVDMTSDGVRLTRSEPCSIGQPELATDEWGDEELRAAVLAYIEIRDRQLAGGDQPAKSAYYRSLSKQFGRTPKAFEFRMQNISYVLHLMGRQWVEGLMPARNVGARVAARIEAIFGELQGLSAAPAAAFDVEVRRAKRKLVHQPAGQEKPKATTAVVTQFARDPLVKAWVLSQAGGSCECCLGPAPFETVDGPFLEVHHLRRLCDFGPDTVSNAVAICPNCHRRLHYGLDARALIEGMYSRLTRLARH